VEAGNDQAQARAAMAQLLKTENRSDRDKVRAFVGEHLLEPEKAPARAFYLDEMAVGHQASYVTDTFEPVGQTTLAERVELARKVAGETFPGSLLRLALDEVAQGRTPEQAADRTLEFSRAAEASRRYQSDSDHWRLTVKEAFDFYHDHLRKPENEPVRKLFLQLLADKKAATSVSDILEPVKGLDLKQRTAVFQRLQQGLFPRAIYELVTTAVKGGDSLEQAEAKAAEFAKAVESSRRYQGQSDHWRLTAKPAHEFYRDQLLAPARESARKLFLQLLAEKKDALSVSHVLPEVAGLDLDARIALFGELQQHKFANPMYDLTTAAMAQGASLEKARELTREFSVAGESGRRYQGDSDHWRLTLGPACEFYQENLLSPDREPARRLFLSLLAGKKEPKVVSHVLPEVKAITLEQRVEVFQEFDKDKFGTRLYDLWATAIEAGAKPEQARQLTQDFAEAAELGRRYQGDSDHWRLTVKEPYEFYTTNLLTPDREPARQLFLRLLGQKKDATSVGHVLPEAGGLTLGQRIELFDELQTAKFPIPMYDLVKASLNQGHDLEEARELARQFSTAAESGRRYNSDSDHWRLTVREAYEFYQNHLLSAEATPVRQYFLELLADKQDPRQVEHALADLPGLDLAQRVSLLRELNSHHFGTRMYDLVAGAIEAGQSPERGKALAGDFAKAAESGRRYAADSDHWRLTVRDPYEFYHDQLLMPEREPARRLFLKLLAEKKQPLEVKSSFKDIPNTTLEQRVALLEELGQFAEAAFHLLEEGATLEQARSEAGR
ncbi:MAG: hypothetical protein KC910_28265, partial [Candidatus Eremiobacteraeota bacterium]|nr:hypothetical protein [Candidatus Eremiobacteraeota bacterium]